MLSISKQLCSGGKKLFTQSSKTWAVQEIVFHFFNNEMHCKEYRQVKDSNFSEKGDNLRH